MRVDLASVDGKLHGDNSSHGSSGGKALPYGGGGRGGGKGKGMGQNIGGYSNIGGSGGYPGDMHMSSNMHRPPARPPPTGPVQGVTATGGGNNYSNATMDIITKLIQGMNRCLHDTAIQVCATT